MLTPEEKLRHRKEHQKEYRKTPARREYDKKYRNSPKAKEYQKKYRESPKAKAYQEKYRKSPKGKKYHKEYGKKYSIKYWYNLENKDYDKIFNEQKGCCAICGVHQSKLKRALSVDHDHKTNEVRGLLCIKCNVALGIFNDSIELLDRAKHYLKKYKSTLNIKHIWKKNKKSSVALENTWVYTIVRAKGEKQLWGIKRFVSFARKKFKNPVK